MKPRNLNLLRQRRAFRLRRYAARTPQTVTCFRRYSRYCPIVHLIFWWLCLFVLLLHLAYLFYCFVFQSKWAFHWFLKMKSGLHKNSKFMTQEKLTVLLVVLLICKNGSPFVDSRKRECKKIWTSSLEFGNYCKSFLFTCSILFLI